MKLQDRVVVVTGAAKGIGLGCARVCAKHGASVVLADVDESAGNAEAEALRRSGSAAVFTRCDVTDESAVRLLIESSVAHYGQLDCLVNNAGWHPPAVQPDDITVDDFERLMRLNLTSAFMGCRYAIPHLKATRGSIVNLSSLVALIGQAQAVSYVTTKAGLVGLTKALALDLASAGVRVNAICPAAARTPLLDEWAASQYDPAAALQAVDSWHALGRMATIDEIGEVCAFLASNEASFITGQTICPDGGAALGYRV